MEAWGNGKNGWLIIQGEKTRDSAVVQWVKPMPAMLTSQIAMLVQVLAVLLQIQYPASVSEEAMDVRLEKVPNLLPALWKTWRKFLAPDSLLCSFVK